MAGSVRWQQRRWATAFIVGVLVLSVLAAGGIYLARQRGEQVRRDDAIKIAEQNLAEQAQPVTQEEKVVVREAAADPASSGTASQPALPVSGPEQALGIIPMSLIVAAFMYYLGSRRALMFARQSRP